MEVSDCFDGGFGAPCTIEEDRVTFDMSDFPHVLSVRLTGAARPVEVVLNYTGDNKAAKEHTKALKQGLLCAADGEATRILPLAEDGPRLRATIPGGMDWVGTLFRYGRDGLDRLLCDAAGGPARIVHRERGGRSFPEFHFGPDDAPLVHYIVGGEDAIESNGQLQADAMVRVLCADDALRDRLTQHAAVRVAPLVTPYSAAAITTAKTRSYVSPDGRHLYGAATYNDDPPPPEYALVRETLDALIADRRLGLCLAIHGHGGMTPYDFETIRTAGDHRLADDRAEHIDRMMADLHRGIAGVDIRLGEKIWHGGLIRDYTLRRHGVASFRLEARSQAQHFPGPGFFATYARRLLENVAAIDDWTCLYP